MTSTPGSAGQTGAPMSPRPDRILRRFSTGERWVHRTTAVLFGVLLATAAVLYFGPLSQLVGRRNLVATVHVYAGLLLPVPLLVGWVRSRALRRDVRVLNRFSANDWAWLRSKDRRSGRIPVGKFNAGQKLNAAFTVGAIAVMLMTGSIMHWTDWFPLAWRTGATFVHDWLAFSLAVVIAGHIYMAANDPVARLGMRTGGVPLSWARREHGAWAAHAEASSSTRRRGPGDAGAPAEDDPAGTGRVSR
jgi:formate dehydrogenase subunit gamma